MEAYQSSNLYTQSQPEAVSVASYALVISLQEELRSLQERVKMLEEYGVFTEWLTRQQVMIYLGVGETTLWKISVKNPQIVKCGNHFQFKSCRDYLMKKCVSKEVIEARMREVLKAKANKFSKYR